MKRLERLMNQQMTSFGHASHHTMSPSQRCQQKTRMAQSLLGFEGCQGSVPSCTDGQEALFWNNQVWRCRPAALVFFFYEPNSPLSQYLNCTIINSLPNGADCHIFQYLYCSSILSTAKFLRGLKYNSSNLRNRLIQM